MWPFKKKFRPLAIDKTPKAVTSIHPEYKKKILHAFDIRKEDGEIVSFYEFGSIHDMPSRRFGALNNFIEDNNRKMTHEELLHYSDEALREIDDNSPSSLANAVMILKMMKMRAEFIADIDIVLRLVSCVYFTKDEDLLNYDWDIGDWKIELFEKYGLNAFFLTEPIRKFLPVTNISENDIKAILEQKEITKVLLKQLRELEISTINQYDAKKQLQNST